MTSSSAYQKLIKPALILLIIVLTAVILKFGKPFLVPLTFAGLLAMLLLPITRWLEKKGVNRIVSTVLSILVFLSVIAIVFFFIGRQIGELSKDSSKIEQQITSKYQQAQNYVAETLGIPKQKQEQMIKEQQSSSGGKAAGMVTGVLSGITGIITDFIIVLVYIFLLIYFRGHLKRFILRVVPEEQEGNAKEIIQRSQKVTQKYLTGMALMIMALWVMYGIGFSIAGVKSPIFFAVICGILELIPFVGNLVGNGLAILMSLVQGGDMNVVVGILITYAVVQFLQTYILEPLVVGSEVNINPLFTIVGLVAGELIWGIAGMVLAIPILGVTKIICDNIIPLRPYGQLIGEDKKEDTNSIKKVFKKVQNKVAGH